MEYFFNKYENSLVQSGLVEKGVPVLGFLDADIEWNRIDSNIPKLEIIFQSMNINSILFSRAAEPYNTIIAFLARRSDGVIQPKDCETRTFLHDLPVAFSFKMDRVIPILKQRKGVIIPDYGIITYGTVSLEQAYVSFSSICFACFVKFFSDYLQNAKEGMLDQEYISVFNKVVKKLDSSTSFNNSLSVGPFKSEGIVYHAMDEAGKLTVKHRLVDSFFGNLSCYYNSSLYISQTGSSLDNLNGCIDTCPLDGSSCASITASSELSAHMQIAQLVNCKTILHGHPKFSVIMSMDCDVYDCLHNDQCHIKCPYKRFVCGIPIVPGEVGTGKYGLCNTLPPAMKDYPGVIVYGHGLFTKGNTDFNEPFRNLHLIENQCRMEFFNKVQAIS